MWVQGTPRLGLMYGCEAALGSKGMEVKADRQYTKYRKEWRALAIPRPGDF